MKSAVWTASDGIRVGDHPRPVPEANEALIAVTYTGICGSDLEEYLHGPIVATSPVVLGHEIAGMVLEAAVDGSGPPEGTRVVVDVVLGCGTCWWCEQGAEGLCPDLQVVGQHLDGGLSELLCARADRLLPIPGSVSDREAALAEPLAVAVRAMTKVGDVMNEHVLVIGGGTIGLLTAQVARSRGAAQVAVLEPNPSRRALLRQWGIQGLWHNDPPGRRQVTDAAFGIPGPTVVIECSGKQGMTAEALELCARGGQVIALGVLNRPEPIDTLDLVLREKTLRGSAAHLWNTDVRTAVELLASGKVDVKPLITHVIALDDANTAFELVASGDDSVIKVLIDCTSQSTL